MARVSFSPNTVIYTMSLGPEGKRKAPPQFGGETTQNSQSKALLKNNFQIIFENCHVGLMLGVNILLPRRIAATRIKQGPSKLFQALHFKGVSMPSQAGTF